MTQLAYHIDCKLDPYFGHEKKKPGVYPGNFFIWALGALTHFLCLLNIPFCGCVVVYSTICTLDCF